MDNSEAQKDAARDLSRLAHIEKDVGAKPYLEAFRTDEAQALIGRFAKELKTLSPPSNVQDDPSIQTSAQGHNSGSVNVEFQESHLRIGIASLSAFLQANVTGPVLEGADEYERTVVGLIGEYTDKSASEASSKRHGPLDILRMACLRSLDTDGVSPYPHVPYIELFSLARWIFTSGAVLPHELVPQKTGDFAACLAWMRFRIHLWHYKLLSQPSLGPGSLFNKSGRWTDVPSLQGAIEKSMAVAEKAVLGEAPSGTGDFQVQFLLEKASALILLGLDVKAREALTQATKSNGFVYALSGALGKRTKFQEKTISQLVVLAKSRDDHDVGLDSAMQNVPESVQLNDDTLLEKLSFQNDEGNADVSESNLPQPLRGLKPDDQPRLKPEDQIALLTEATLMDAFSTVDSLTAEEILPFAVRVIEEKGTNWQIYTQALLVRSRIELNRSRTIERGVLQLQAVVDQVIIDTESPSTGPNREETSNNPESSENSSGPTIQITDADEPLPTSNKQPDSTVSKPTSFLRAAKAGESAPASTRLQYVSALSSAPRWHLEAELAYAWTAVGSLVSALEIFKRLRLWPEVALCLASNAAQQDEDGRGSGGEEKARAILRWQLFEPTSTDIVDPKDDEPGFDKYDVLSMKPANFAGPARQPPPPNAPRMLCILGDMENDAEHYQLAWEISNGRYTRAQKSLGELHLQKQDWGEALKSYQLAVRANRLNPELWNRLGDIQLRLGYFPDAAVAFQRAISTSNDLVGGEEARTWSNLGTSLLSWYREVIAEGNAAKEKVTQSEEAGDKEPVQPEHTTMSSTQRAADLNMSASKLLQDSLTAFKRGATIADSNWRIWDNVITLAASLTPTPGFDDVILGTRNVIRIKQSEDALDVEILTLLAREVTRNNPPPGEGIYTPPRASLESKVLALFEQDIVPLVTTNSACWSLISRLRAWTRDFDGGMDAAEKSWRTAIGGVGSGSTLAASSATNNGDSSNWLENRDSWDIVVNRTEELVAAYENWGERVESIGSKWKGKARSAIRSVLGKAKENWEGSEGWNSLEALLEGLKN